MKLEIQPKGMAGEGTQPPVSAVGDGKVDLWQLGKERFAPRACLYWTHAVDRKTGVPEGRLLQYGPGADLPFLKRVAKDNNVPGLEIIHQGCVKP